MSSRTLLSVYALRRSKNWTGLRRGKWGEEWRFMVFLGHDVAQSGRKAPRFLKEHAPSIFRIFYHKDWGKSSPERLVPIYETTQSVTSRDENLNLREMNGSYSEL
jgi:hypothetical protein